MAKVRAWLAAFPAALTMLVIGGQLMFAGIADAQVTSPITSIGGIQGFLCNIVGYFFWFILALSVIMILWAAYTYITAGDDTEKTSKARKIITYAAIGIAVALISNAFPAIINSILPTPATGVNTQTC